MNKVAAVAFDGFRKRDGLVVPFSREKIIQASIYTGWDEQNLYLAVRNVDDEVNFPRQEAELGRGDRLVIGLDTRLEADIFETRRSEDDFLIQLDALAEKGRARLVNWRGEAVELPVGFRRVLAGAEDVEIAEGHSLETIGMEERTAITLRGLFAYRVRRVGQGSHGFPFGKLGIGTVDR